MAVMIMIVLVVKLGAFLSALRKLIWKIITNTTNIIVGFARLLQKFKFEQSISAVIKNRIWGHDEYINDGGGGRSCCDGEDGGGEGGGAGDGDDTDDADDNADVLDDDAADDDGGGVPSTH